jgi:hypothetical protein
LLPDRDRGLEGPVGGGNAKQAFFIWIRRNPLKSPESDE